MCDDTSMDFSHGLSVKPNIKLSKQQMKALFVETIQLIQLRRNLRVHMSEFCNTWWINQSIELEWLPTTKKKDS